MSPFDPKKQLSKEAAASPNFRLASKDLKGLSSEVLKALLEQVQAGDRNAARSFISRSLNVNDVVAEYCLRHLEENLTREQNYRERILELAGSLGTATASDQQAFLRDAFGVQGIVSKAILNHWRIAGT